MSRESIQTIYVLEKIKEDIVYRKLTNNELLTESYLAGRLGFSRTPIREAVKILEQQGLLKRENGRIKINFLDHFQSIELELVRISLEGLAAEYAARRIEEDGKQRLLSALDKISNYEGRNLFELSKLNDEFHLSIAIESRLFYLVDILQNIQTKLKLSQSVKFISPDRRLDSDKEHRLIIDLIVAKKAPEAKKMAEDHVRKTYDLLLRSIPSSEIVVWKNLPVVRP